jgi:hypothetical protein
MGLCCTHIYIFTAYVVNTVLQASTPTYEDRIIGTDREQEQRPTDRKTDAQNLKRQLPTSGMCNGVLKRKSNFPHIQYKKIKQLKSHI